MGCEVAVDRADANLEVVCYAVQAHIEPIGCEQLLRAIENPLSIGDAIFARLSGASCLGHGSKMVRRAIRVYARWRRAVVVSTAAPSRRMMTPTITAAVLSTPLTAKAGAGAAADRNANEWVSPPATAVYVTPAGSTGTFV